MRIQLTYTPEGGSKRTWTFEPDNPAWDLAFVTEKETGWAWEEFVERLSHGSHIGLRAMVYAFRKRDEPRLTIDAVTVSLAEIDIVEVEEVEPKLKAVKGKAGEA